MLFHKKDKKQIKEDAPETAVNQDSQEQAGVSAEPVGKTFHVMKYFIAVLVCLVLFWFGFTCVVREGSCALILRFGAVREEITDAGVYLKLPWPFESVVSLDSRLQYLESNRLETTTKDKRNIILQSCVVWKIEDPVLYHNSVDLNKSADIYLNDQVFSATNSVLGSYNLDALVSTEKQICIDEIQKEIFTRVQKNCKKNYGIDVVDVSIMTLSLPTNNLNSIFAQMSAERQKEIDTILAQAQTKANKIRTDADAEATRIQAEGVTKASEIRAETETEVARIYAEAQAANIELYKFLQELDTVVSSVNSSSVLVVRADEYPFNVLKKYSETVALTANSNEVVVEDLSYIMTKMPEKDRNALSDSISELIIEKAKE